MTLTLTQAKRITRNTYWVVWALVGLVLSFSPMPIGGVFVVTLLSGIAANFIGLAFVYLSLKKSGQWNAFKAKMSKESSPGKTDHVVSGEISRQDSSVQNGGGVEYNFGQSHINGFTTYTFK